MFSSRQFILFFFVLTTLLATGSARDLFFWARQNGQQDGTKGNGGNNVNSGGETTDVTSPAATLSPTSDVQDSTTQQATSTPQSSTPISTSAVTSTPTSTSKVESTSTTDTPTSSASTTPENTSEVVVVQTQTVSGSAVEVTHTTPAGSTATGDLASQSSSSGGSSGMTQQQKSVAIGVGVGVGGAILIGALAIIIWRMWGRKKHNPEEDHFLMNDPLAEKPNTPSTAASPFKSTLDQYHNPAGRLNTAANF